MSANLAKTKALVQAAAIAALYTVLTMVSTLLGLSSGAVQVRLGEALCVLPAFLPAAVPGLTVGCFLSNLLSGCLPWDIVFGTLATLLGALGTRALRNRRFACLLPPVAANTLIVPLILKWAYHLENAWWLLALCVLAGEVVSCVLLGGVLRRALEKNGSLFR